MDSFPCPQGGWVSSACRGCWLNRSLFRLPVGKLGETPKSVLPKGCRLCVDVREQQGHHMASLKRWSTSSRTQTSTISCTPLATAQWRMETPASCAQSSTAKILSQRRPVPEPVNLVDVHGLTKRMLAYRSAGKTRRRPHVVMGASATRYLRFQLWLSVRMAATPLRNPLSRQVPWLIAHGRVVVLRVGAGGSVGPPGLAVG